MSRTIVINNRTFTINKKALDTRVQYGTIEQAYGRPSQNKVRIYESWLRWASDASVYGFGIVSKNTNVFTLGGSVHVDGKTYRIYITPSSNYAWEI